MSIGYMSIRRKKQLSAVLDADIATAIIGGEINKIRREELRIQNEICNQRKLQPPEKQTFSEKRTPPKKQTEKTTLKKKIGKVVRQQCWCKRNGRSLDGKCYCYKRNITYDEFECGHIHPESQGGGTLLNNLEPICRTCNRSMGTTNMKNLSNLFLNDYGLIVGCFLFEILY